MEKLETLKNVTVNVDSATAERIANSYLTFRYVENFTVAIVILLLVWLVTRLILKSVDA